MATTINELQDIGIDTNSSDFEYGYNYAMATRKNAVQKMVEWAKSITNRA